MFVYSSPALLRSWHIHTHTYTPTTTSPLLLLLSQRRRPSPATGTAIDFTAAAAATAKMALTPRAPDNIFYLNWSGSVSCPRSRRHRPAAASWSRRSLATGTYPFPNRRPSWSSDVHRRRAGTTHKFVYSRKDIREALATRFKLNWSGHDDGDAANMSVSTTWVPTTV